MTERTPSSARTEGSTPARSRPDTDRVMRLGAAQVGAAEQDAIQEVLRSEHAAVSVRIGIHWAEVTHAEGDFSGRGVHEAARISALATGGEVLASAATLDAATKTYATAAERTVELRGLPGEFVVVSVLDPQ